MEKKGEQQGCCNHCPDALKVTILMPLFNDWESLRSLLLRIDDLRLTKVSHLRVVVANDCSSMPIPEKFLHGLRLSQIEALVVLDLACNVGHQRAIALGLATIASDEADDLIVVMDCDGEDDPDDVPKLITAHCDHPGAVIVAERSRRSEGTSFRLGYYAYRIVFRVLTGRAIRFGNFCAMDIEVAKGLTNNPNTWNHLAATLLRFNRSIVEMPTRRGQRFSGKSSANLVALITHGLSAMAVYSDYVFARLMFASAALGGVALLGAALVVFLRLFTELAVPGWATAAAGIFAILFTQACLLLLVASLQILSNRNQAAAVPARLIDDFIQCRRDFSFAQVE